MKINFSPGSNNLRSHGPIIKLKIGYPEAEFEAAISMGLYLPRPREVHGLIDTGASVTIINPQLAEFLNLPQLGEALIHAAGHSARYQEYIASVYFAGSELQRFEYLRIVACPIASREVSCLIGRDILQHWKMSYNGFSGQFSIQDVPS